MAQQYEYGYLPEDEKYLGLLGNIFSPVRREVLEAPTTEYVDVIDAPMGTQMPVTTEGVYGDPEFGLQYMPAYQAVSGLLGLEADQIVDAAKSAPEALRQMANQQVMSGVDMATGGTGILVDDEGNEFGYDSFLMAAPLAPAGIAAKLDRGVTLGAMGGKLTKAEKEAPTGLLDEPDVSYRIAHQPRSPEDDLPVRLDDLTKSTTGEAAGFPDYFYTPEGRRIFAPSPRFAGDEYGIAGQQSYRAISGVRGNPDAEVTIYRGVPNDPEISTINRGDFVTLSPKYAELHAASGYGRSGDEAGKVISQKVKVKDIYWDGNDVNEFGYFPERRAR